MSSIASIMSMVDALSLNEKLQLNAQLAALMAGGEVSIEAPAPASAAKASKKTSARAGKPAAPGTKAWSAFIEHCRSTMPDRFAPPALPKDRMVIAKAIKDEDPEAYKAFAAKYVAEHPASEVASVASASSDAEGSELIPYRDWGAKAEKPEKPKRVMSDEQKAKMKAGREAAKAKKDAAIAAGETPSPAKKTKAAKAPGAPKKAAAAAPSVGGGGSVAAAAASSPSGAAPIAQPVFEEDGGLTKVTVAGDEYFLQTATNDLYAIDGDSMGAFVGRYDPATEEIDFDAEPSDE